MYGESVFTTMRMVGGIIQDWELHFDRLHKGVEFVYGPFSDTDDWVALLQRKLEEHLVELSSDSIVRLSVYLAPKGRTPLRTGPICVSDLRIQVDVSPLSQHRPENRIALRTCTAAARPQWWPSYLKAGSYLETILSQKLFLQKGDDDLLFLSSTNTVLETSVANIFFVHRKRLSTAPLGPNVLEGVMRRKVLNMADAVFDSVVEAETTLEELHLADAVFGANSVRGLFLVDRIDDHAITYTQDFLELFARLRKLVAP